MKRLNLEAFKAQNEIQTDPTEMDQLLGQVLGNCHDKPKDEDPQDEAPKTGRKKIKVKLIINF